MTVCFLRVVVSRHEHRDAMLAGEGPRRNRLHGDFVPSTPTRRNPLSAIAAPSGVAIWSSGTPRLSPRLRHHVHGVAADEQKIRAACTSIRATSTMRVVVATCRHSATLISPKSNDHAHGRCRAYAGAGRRDFFAHLLQHHARDGASREKARRGAAPYRHAVGAAIADRGLRRVGVLGTKFTMQADFLRGPLPASMASRCSCRLTTTRRKHTASSMKNWRAGASSTVRANSCSARSRGCGARRRGRHSRLHRAAVLIEPKTPRFLSSTPPNCMRSPPPTWRLFPRPTKWGRGLGRGTSHRHNRDELVQTDNPRDQENLPSLQFAQ